MIKITHKYIMPYSLEHWGKKAIVVDDKGRHYSNMPIAVTRAKAQMKALHIHVKEKLKKQKK